MHICSNDFKFCLIEQASKFHPSITHSYLCSCAAQFHLTYNFFVGGKDNISLMFLSIPDKVPGKLKVFAFIILLSAHFYPHNLLSPFYKYMPTHFTFGAPQRQLKRDHNPISDARRLPLL